MTPAAAKQVKSKACDKIRVLAACYLHHLQRICDVATERERERGL